MDYVTSIFSPAATRDPPRVDLGVIELTDSEPEDLDNDDLLRTGLDENTASNISSYRNRDNVKEDFPMDVGVDVPAAQAGPSTHLLDPDPLSQVPLIHTEPEAEPHTTQELDTVNHSEHLALILEVIPDFPQKHAMELIENLYPTYGDQVVERILQGLLDDPSYLKVEKDVAGKGKTKEEVSEMEDVLERPPPPRVGIDFASVDRPKPIGVHYTTLALDKLYDDFSRIPRFYIRRVLTSNNGLYAPTHIQLTEEMESNTPPPTMKACRIEVPMEKGKERETQDHDFEEERAWLLLQTAPAIDGFLQDQPQGATETPLIDSYAPVEEEGGFECGCCFSPVPFHNLIQCPDAHLFCTDCMAAYTSNLLGEHNFKIVCIDQSGCKLPFPESELKRFITPKLLSLYEKLKQAKEIEMAGLDGLEECPHCEFKGVIDDPSERLFRCQNEECGAVTCRKCKRPDHLPKSCAEADKDKKSDARHVVEEAMTSALLRNCPQCSKAFIKESGCNKMTCPNCRTLSCYVCREVITGYEHFNTSRSGQPQRADHINKCLLWDKVEERHQKEVEEAQEKAIAEYRKEHPEMGKGALHVELPKATGEASGSTGPRLRARPAPLFPNELLRLAQDPELNRRRQGWEAPRQRHGPALQFANVLQKVHPAPEVPDVHLPQPKIPYLFPVRAGQHQQRAQEVPQQRDEELRRHLEEVWTPRRRLAQQQRVLAGIFTRNNLRNPHPPALPDDPIYPIPQPQGNEAGGVRMDQMDRGGVDLRRRVVPGPEPEDRVTPFLVPFIAGFIASLVMYLACWYHT